MSEAIIAFYLAGACLGIIGLIYDMDRFRKTLKHHNQFTRGDLAACILFGMICPPVGWFMGLKILIGLKIDWDAPLWKRGSHE